MFMTACDDDEQLGNLKEIPSAIKEDFQERHPSVEVISVDNWSDGTCEIKFIDNEKNEAIIKYINGVWKMTHTRLNDLNQLSPKAQSSFKESEYGYAEVLDIYKTERDKIERTLYTLHFKYHRKHIKDVEHNVFLNDDGVILKIYTSTFNDPTWFAELPVSHFDFIKGNYSGAEIRGYMNNGGYHEYFVLHDSIIKYVSFRGDSPAEREFWHETRYELSKDASVPVVVINRLKQQHPDFIYTNIYCIESNEGNSYLFVDKNHKNELGYYVSDGIYPPM